MRRVLRVLAWVVGGLLVASVGGCLALQRPEIPFDVLEARYASPASRFMDLPGGLHVHYRDQGNPNGPVLVMVHGFSASLQAWEPWVAQLGGDYRIITLDLPAHGLTRAPRSFRVSMDVYADTIDAVMTRLGVNEPYVVIGNSMGGGAAWTLALRHPDRVRALVLVDSVGMPGAARPGAQAREGPPGFVSILSSPLIRWAWQNIDLRYIAEKGLRLAYVEPALVTPELVNRYLDMSRAPGHRDILLGGQGPPRMPDPAVFADIKTPTLVIHGEADRVIEVTAGRALAAAIPGARLITYPGVGHVPMEQIPERSAADVRRFLEGLAAPALPAPSAGGLDVRGVR